MVNPLSAFVWIPHRSTQKRVPFCQQKHGAGILDRFICWTPFAGGAVRSFSAPRATDKAGEAWRETRGVGGIGPFLKALFEAGALENGKSLGCLDI